MEEARKASTPAVLKATLPAFKKEMLNEHLSLWPQARIHFKEAWSAYILKQLSSCLTFCWSVCQPSSTYETQNRTGHPGYPAVQLRLTCDQIRTGSESLHVKYGAKEKREMEINGNHLNMPDHWQATRTGLSTYFMYCSSYHFKKLN